MPEQPAFAPGTPSWIDLGSPDLGLARAFYQSLFGWVGDVSPLPEADGYTMFRLGERYVAGLGNLVGDGPSTWTTYVTVADADLAARLVAASGGTVLHPPQDVLDVGRMALLSDPTGAVFAIWEPGSFAGAELVGRPGSMCWNELACRDGERVGVFYRAVFGWEGTTEPFAGSSYTRFTVGGESVAGMIEMNDRWPPDAPSHWLVYFAVDDADAVAARASDLGGTVMVRPTEIPPGRFSVLADPAGAVFAVIKLAVSE